jgi:hypothetical protein
MVSNRPFFAIDWSQVRPEVATMLGNREARIFNGVARRLDGSYRILQHMPFREVSLEMGSDLVTAAQSAASVPAALASVQTIVMMSTAVTVGAIVLSTEYLATRLTAIDQAIGALRREARDEQLLGWLDRSVSYVGALRALREVTSSRALLNENGDMVLQLLADLLVKRNHVVTFLEELSELQGRFTPITSETASAFLESMTTLLPKGVFLESRTAYCLERFRLGDNTREHGCAQYCGLLDRYRASTKELARLVVRGEAGCNTGIQTRVRSVRRMMALEENRLLLAHST